MAATHPIRRLREHVTALEAAITLALANPEKEPVHRLRTSTRRIEAQLELLALLPDLPDYAKPAKKARKLLKKLRRAAGTVRDLDVQRDLLKEMKGNKDQKSASKKLRAEARDLRRSLKQQRSTEAAKLTAVLKLEQRKLTPALEDLLGTLKGAENLALSPARLASLTETWYRENTPAAGSGEDPEFQPDRLHAIRKSAKLARYIAEEGATRLARTFEAIQQAGGTWHDLLTLADIASDELGSRSELTRIFTDQRNTALDGYRTTLHQHKHHTKT